MKEKYEINAKVEFCAAVRTSFNSIPLRGVMKNRIGYIKALRRDLLGRYYLICEARSLEVFKVRPRHVFGAGRTSKANESTKQPKEQ